jgi:hypothetical protein
LAGTVTNVTGAVASLTHGTGNGRTLAGSVSSTTGALLNVSKGHGNGQALGLTAAAANATNGAVALTRSGQGGGSGLGVQGALAGATSTTASLTHGASSVMAGGSASGNGSASAGRHHANASGSASVSGSGSLLGLDHGGLPNGIRIINGVPCGPDGIPLTGPQLASLGALPSMPTLADSAPSGNNASPGTGSPSGQQGRGHDRDQADRKDLWWPAHTTNQDRQGRLYDH